MANLTVAPLTKEEVSRHRRQDPNIAGLKVGERLLALQTQRVTQYHTNANDGAHTVTVFVPSFAIRLTKVRWAADVVSAADDSSVQVKVGATNLHTAIDVDQADEGAVLEADPTEAVRDVAGGSQIVAVITAATGATVAGLLQLDYIPIETSEGAPRS